MNSGTPEETDTAARPWTDVSLYASWSDGFRREAQKPRFREAWSPLPDAEELYLVSCYVDDNGLKLLERMLHENPKLVVTLIFSQVGIMAGHAAAFARFWQQLLADPELSTRVVVYLLRRSPDNVNSGQPAQTGRGI